MESRPLRARAFVVERMACEQAALRVAVRDLGGSSLKLEVDPLCTVRALKEQLASSRHMPALCQTLMLDTIVLEGSQDLLMPETVVLEDSQDLLSYCQDGSNALELLLVVSSQKAYDSLASGCTGTKLAAMSAIAHTGDMGDERVLKKLNDLFDDDSLRQQAANTMSRLAPLGHTLTISLMQRRLSAVQPDIAVSALGVISRVARHSAGEQVRVHVEQLASHQSPQLRAAALRTLACIVRPGDSATVRRLQRGMEDPDKVVRAAAVRALSTLALAESDEMADDGSEGSSHHDGARLQAVFSALHAALEHADAGVRQCTLELMPKLVAACSVEPTGLLPAIFACTTDQAEEVRIAALHAASEICLRRQNERLLAAVTSLSRDTCATVRQAAVSAAADLAHAGVLAAVGLLSNLFGDTDSRVRRSAVESLAEVAEASCSEGEEPELRAVVEAARFHAIHLGIAGVKDDAKTVRLAAGAALARLDVVGHQLSRDQGSNPARVPPPLHRHYSEAEVFDDFPDSWERCAA